MALAVNIGALPQPSFGENLSRLSHIPFWDAHQTDEKRYETTFQQDFKSFATLTKRAAIHHPSLVKVDQKDPQYIREYETEMARSFTPHHLSPLSRIPAWTKLTTNLKMHSDQRYKDFETTQAESFQRPPTLSAVPRPVCLFLAASMKPRDFKLPETTQRASYVSYKVSPLVITDRKHQETAPAIRGDGKLSFFSSSYKDAFQYRWSSPPPPTETQFHSSLVMGDKDKISENETTHSTAFSYTGAQSPVLMIKRPCVNLGDLRDYKWTTTTSEAFNAIQPERVQIKLGNVTRSCVPRGDMDKRRNQERSTATTNRFFFSEENHKEFPVRMDSPSLRTKSNVEFGRPSMEGMFYSTTAQESYPHKYVTRVKPWIYPSGRVLADQEPGPAVTTVQSDYVPLNPRKHIFKPEQINASHIRPPNSEFYFKTTHKDAFSFKPKSEVLLDNPPIQHIRTEQISHIKF